jgi:hypothetical protein
METVQEFQRIHTQLPNNPFYDCNIHLSLNILVVYTILLKYIL